MILKQSEIATPCTTSLTGLAGPPLREDESDSKSTLTREESLSLCVEQPNEDQSAIVPPAPEGVVRQTDNRKEGEAAGVIARIECQEPEISTLQRQDPMLVPVMKFLEAGLLPENDVEARRVILTASQFTMEGGILYRVASDGTLRFVPPAIHRKSLFQQAHSGVFGAHLGEAKVFSELQKHLWWRGMRADITR